MVQLHEAQAEAEAASKENKELQVVQSLLIKLETESWASNCLQTWWENTSSWLQGREVRFLVDSIDDGNKKNLSR